MSLPTHSAPATSLSISRRLSRAALEFLPPFAVSAVDLALHHPVREVDSLATVDDRLAGLRVRRQGHVGGQGHLRNHHAVLESLLHLSTDRGDPDDAAGLRPLRAVAGGLDRRPGMGSAVGLEALRCTAWLEAWTHRHCVLLAVEPIRTTLGYGQVNTILMALVIADLLPDAPGERRRIPQGTLIGLAAAIKLTPALFVIFAFLIGKTRMAITAMISFAVFTGIGAILLFRETLVFFGGLSGGDTRTASPLYTGNQSLLGVFFRLGDSSRVTALVGLAVSAVLAVLGCLVAAHWWRHEEKVFAVAIVGLTTCLASPLSWTHHYVWILPLGMAVLSPGVPRWARYLGGFWVVWVCLCLPLAVLPYGGGRERQFDFLQQLVANLGPIIGVILVVGLAWQLVATPRLQPAKATAG